MPPPMPKGWIPEPYDPRDKYYDSTVTAADKVNLFQVKKAWVSPVYYQSNTGTCVANATAAAFRYTAKRMADAEHVEPAVKDPSRLFIYFNARALQSGVPDGVDIPQPQSMTDHGTWNRFALRGVNRWGVCSEKSWPFTIVGAGASNESVEHVNDSPTDAAYQEGKSCHAIEYCRLDPDHPDNIELSMPLDEREAIGAKTLSRLRQCLTEGYPVVFGFNYYWNEDKGERVPWIEKDDDIYRLDSLPANQQHQKPPPENGGHTVLAIGYDDSRNEILCLNSWGTKDTTGEYNWKSKDGLFWMNYTWITDWEATDDFWMIRKVETAPKV